MIEREKMALNCVRENLDRKTSSLKQLSNTEKECLKAVVRSLSLNVFKEVWSCHLRTWSCGGDSSVRLKVELDDFRSLLQLQ